MQAALSKTLLVTITPFALMACSADSRNPGTPGTNPDTGRTVAADSGTTTDSGTETDSGTQADSGTETPDTGATFMDATANPDAAAPQDSGTAADAGMVAMDAMAPADTGPAPCNYPSGAPASPTDGQLIAPYRWASALDAQRNSFELDLNEVFCNTDADIDWGQFNYVLFASLPAW